MKRRLSMQKLNLEFKNHSLKLTARWPNS